MIKTIGKWTAIVVAVLFLLGAAALFWPWARAPLPNQARDYLIESIRIVDVTAGVAGPPVSVLVRDGIIVAIGPNLLARRTVRVDGRGKFLMSGLWDMHMHSFQLSPQMHFPLFVANGVTSARDMMDCPQPQDSLIACVSDKKRWNRDVDRGRLAAPRIVQVASYYFDDPSTTPAEARRKAALYAQRGIGALKVYNRLPRTAYFAVASEARAHGLRLVGHLPKAVSLEEAIAAGQSSFEHAHLLVRHCFRGAAGWRAGKLDSVPPTILTETMVTRFDPVACEAIYATIKQANAWYVPTHVTREEDARAGDAAFVEDARLDYLDPLSRWAFRDDLTGTVAAYPGVRGQRALRAYFEHGLRLTGQAHRAGVRILIGTDTAIGGFRYHDEMRHLVSAGLTPAEVLRAATIDAARYAGLDRSAGSVAIGKRADLLLLDADPLTDIANAQRISAVFLAGHLYDRKGLNELLTFTRGQAEAPHNWVKLLWGFLRSSVTSDL